MNEEFKVSTTKRRRSSLFGPQIAALKITTPAKESNQLGLEQLYYSEYKEYKETLENLHLAGVSDSKEECPVYDQSILTDEQRNFLANIPDFDAYLRIFQYIEFQHKLIDLEMQGLQKYFKEATETVQKNLLLS